jgi:multimeric flavodoxin WrbA
MNVLGFVGGPHRDGNTKKLVEAVMQGAKVSHHRVLLYQLCDLNINHIEEEGGELHYPNDDFANLYPEIESMNAIVLGTPIYYDHIDSRMKQFIDRFHYWSKTHGLNYRAKFPKGVKLINCITYADDSETRYDEILSWMKKSMEQYWEMKHVADLKAFDTHNISVASNADLLEKAWYIGKNL